MQEVSAGILVYRKNIKSNKIEVLLGKNGGPYWVNRNLGVWNIPKGHVETNENLLDAAVREFQEETGLNIPKEHLWNITYIGKTKTSQNKKVVHIFVLNYDFDSSKEQIPIKSTMCTTEFPPKSGMYIQVPELIECKYIEINNSKRLIFPYQKIFVERLEQLINTQGI